MEGLVFQSLQGSGIPSEISEPAILRPERAAGEEGYALFFIKWEIILIARRKHRRNISPIHRRNILSRNFLWTFDLACFYV